MTTMSGSHAQGVEFARASCPGLIRVVRATEALHLIVRSPDRLNKSAGGTPPGPYNDRPTPQCGQRIESLSANKAAIGFSQSAQVRLPTTIDVVSELVTRIVGA